jgi:lysyl-tRNA synthetase class I
MEAGLGMRWAALDVDFEMFGKDLIRPTQASP